MKPLKNFATETQKEKFRARFAEIVSHNKELSNNYSIQFFDTLVKSNYVFNSLNGKSINVIALLSEPELEQYHVLKNNWQH